MPTAITDLSAHQQGDDAQLIFTLPSKTVTGERLATPPAVEIVRGLPQADGSPDPKSFRVVDTIPGSLLANYTAEGQVKISDPVAPAEIRSHPGGALVYVVRTRASRKRASADSNWVAVRMFPVPEAISTLTARVTQKAVELHWTAPSRTSSGDPLAGSLSYRIYRGELDPSSVEAATKDFSQAKWRSPLTFLASTDQTDYSDTAFDFDKPYAYIVRSVLPAGGNLLESADSGPAILTPRDTFPPAQPQNLVANVVPGETPESVVVDLSWSINLETDLAGYRVYRSGQQGAKGTLLTQDLLLAPAYRDNSVEAGHSYWYTVTAVDRAGNESEPSVPVTVDVEKPSS